MKRVLLRAAFLAACLTMLAVGAMAQGALRVYVTEDALEEGTTKKLMTALHERFDQAEFVLEDDAKSLRELVLADRAPNLAICSPRETRTWAEEGLLLPLQHHVGDQESVAKEVLSSCVLEEKLFMAPLTARHRQMAVNVKMLEKRAMGYMLDEIAHPVWYPTEFQQILEEFAIEDAPAMDVWNMQQDSAAIEALIQAIYCGRLLGKDGSVCQAEHKGIQSGIRWLSDLKKSEMVGYQPTRQAALERFVAGETAIFLDWNAQLQDKYGQQMKDAGMIVETRPYPSSSGLPVRSYELAGVSVFDSHDMQKNAMALQAAAFLHEDAGAQLILGERGIFEDDSIWLWDLSAVGQGATLRSLLCAALEGIFEGDAEIGEALVLLKAGMDAAK